MMSERRYVVKPKHRSGTFDRVKRAKDLVGGYQNTIVLQDVPSCVQQGTADIICGWGLHGQHLGRNAEVLRWFRHYGYPADGPEDHQGRPSVAPVVRFV